MSKLILSSGSDVVDIPINKFPGGEIRVSIPESFIGREECLIKAYITDSDGVMALGMLNGALRSHGSRRIRLTMPYLPYARQDRICNPGEAFSLEVFANMINAMNFSSVLVWDAHSKVALGLLDRTLEMKQLTIMQTHHDMVQYLARAESEPTFLLCPDKGAFDKSLDIVKAYPHLAGIFYGEKQRDLATGKIIKTVIHDMPEHKYLEDAHVLIVDDICDGGRTFIELAKALTDEVQPKSLTLYVTHGIFSAGKEVLFNKKSEPEQEIGSYNKPHTGLFDNVWCSVDFKEYK